MRVVLKLAFDNLCGNNLLHVNLMDKNIYLKRKDIHIGLETGQILQDLIVKSIVYYQYQQQVNLGKTAGKLSLIFYWSEIQLRLILNQSFQSQKIP